MIESVQARQMGSRDFSTIYNQLCALQDSCPLTSVKAHLGQCSLEVNVDRIRLPDWPPILGSLRVNKTLRKVSLRGYYQKPVKPSDGKTSTRRLVQKAPPIYSKDVTYKMCIALKECLQTTEALTSLTVQGIPLRYCDMQVLSKGFPLATTVEHLSFEYCRLSHRSIELLCKGIQSSPSLKSINLTGCGVTAKGAEALSRLIKHQSTSRHSEAWKDSLRYRRPNLDQMPGLRRIVLNNNPLINDAGALHLADSLKDDLWLKALDLQHCGVSDVGASAILEALRGNSTIVVLDLRRNPLVDHNLLKDIIEQVLINADGREEDEYPWRIATSPEPPTKNGRSTAKKKCKIKRKKEGKNSSPAGSSGAEVKPSVTVHKEHRPVTKPGPGFIPWRSAARAEERQRSTTSVANQVQHTAEQRPPGLTKTTSVVHIHQSTQKTRGSSPEKDAAASSVLVLESLSSSGEDDTSTKDETITSSFMSTKRREKEHKEMIVRLEELERRLDLEKEARTAADLRVVELTMENSRLKRHLEILNGRQPATTNGRNGGTMEDLDDDLLKTIEESFKKFHSFLDLLRDAGLGQLCSLVGLTPSELHSPAVANILQSHQPSEPVSRFTDAQPVNRPDNGSERQQSSWADYPQHDAGSQQPHVNGLQPEVDFSRPGGGGSWTRSGGLESHVHGLPEAGHASERASQMYNTAYANHARSANHPQPATSSSQASVSGLQSAGSPVINRLESHAHAIHPHAGGLLPVGHISVSAPTSVDNVASFDGVSQPLKYNGHTMPTRDPYAAGAHSADQSSDEQVQASAPNHRRTDMVHHQIRSHSVDTTPATTMREVHDHDERFNRSSQSAVSSNNGSEPYTSIQQRSGPMPTHHPTGGIGDPPPDVTSRLSHAAASNSSGDDSRSHRGNRSSRIDRTSPSDSRTTVIEGTRQHSNQVLHDRDWTSRDGSGVPGIATSGPLREDLERKIKVVTVEDEDDDDSPCGDKNNRNNNSNVYLEAMSNRHQRGRDLITPNDLGASDSASFHALKPEDVTGPVASQLGGEGERSADPEPGYSDDEFDSSGSSGHSGIRTSTPERTLSEPSRGGVAADGLGELPSNLEEGEIESLSEFSSPEQVAIHGNNSH